MEEKPQNTYEYRKSLPSWDKWQTQRKISKKKYYEKNKEEIIKRTAKWKKENPERAREINKKAVNKLVDQGYFKKKFKEYYEHNKDTHKSRCITRKVVLGSGYIKPNLPKTFFQCRKCGCNDNLQFHHEVYPVHKKEIVEAINKGQIYYLCKKCHKDLHTSNRK